MLRGFVTFEGIDGSGKTTISRRVVAALRAQGVSVFLTREPTKTWTGEAVRRSYKDDVGPLAEAFLFLADRAAHQEEIRGHLDSGDLVVCDRYADSTYAYQGARLEGIVEAPMEFLRRMSEPWILRPDLTVYLRIPAARGLDRIADRPEKVRFEKLAFLRQVARNYDELAVDPRFVTLDASGPSEVVATEALAAIQKRLAVRR